MAMYMNDLCTIPSNLAGNASASFPVGLAPRTVAGRPAGDGAAARRRPAVSRRCSLEAALQSAWGGRCSTAFRSGERNDGAAL